MTGASQVVMGQQSIISWSILKVKLRKNGNILANCESLNMAIKDWSNFSGLWLWTTVSSFRSMICKHKSNCKHYEESFSLPLHIYSRKTLDSWKVTKEVPVPIPLWSLYSYSLSAPRRSLLPLRSFKMNKVHNDFELFWNYVLDSNSKFLQNAL